MPARLMDRSAMSAFVLVICRFQFGDADRIIKTGANGCAAHAQARRLNRARHLLPEEESMDAASRPLAFGHRIDHFLAAIGAIAARKKLRQARLPGPKVVFDRT